MKATLLLALIFLSSTVLAHEQHDWRQDYMAYLSIKYEFPMAPEFKSNAVPAFNPLKTSRLDMEFFKEKLAILTGVKPYFNEGLKVRIKERKYQESLNMARSFLTEEYKKLGLELALHPYGPGTNLIAEKKGITNPEKVLILSSHIDSVGNHGANDNGTGTIGLLTLVRELAKKDFAVTIRVLGFDQEEIGLRGSDAYVGTIDRNNIIGNINFEMMGVNSRNDGAFHLIDCERKDSLFLTDAIKASIADLDLSLNVVKACTTRSDHASFWRKNIPAVVISENFFAGDADPCYHARCDVMDGRLNYEYMEKILSAALDATEKLAGAIE